MPHLRRLFSEYYHCLDIVPLWPYITGEKCRKPRIGFLLFLGGGVTEIRTREALLTLTRFPGVPLQPLEHHSIIFLKSAAKIMLFIEIEIVFCYIFSLNFLWRIFVLRLFCGFFGDLCRFVVAVGIGINLFDFPSQCCDGNCH